MDLSELIVDADEWLYQVSVSSDHEWVNEEVVSGGTRGASIFTQKPGGDKGCIRFDRASKKHSDAYREKVACDLANVIGVPLAPGLLLTRQSDRRIGIVNRVPNGFYNTVEAYSLAIKDKPEGKGWKPRLSKLYPVETIAFDCWVGNRDRRANYGNLLYVEPADGSSPWICPIDYNLCFGKLAEPWSDGSYKQFDMDESNVPVPIFVQLTSSQIRRIRLCCDSIANFPLWALEHIAIRAAEYYGVDTELNLAQSVVEGLTYRQPRIRGWIEAKLIG